MSSEVTSRICRTSSLVKSKSLSNPCEITSPETPETIGAENDVPEGLFVFPPHSVVQIKVPGALKLM